MTRTDAAALVAAQAGDALEVICRMTKDLDNLRRVAIGFADTAERAVAHHRAPKTGMQVPFHGDFANAPPSTITRLAWWAREFRGALAGKDVTYLDHCIALADEGGYRKGYRAALEKAAEVVEREQAEVDRRNQRRPSTYLDSINGDSIASAIRALKEES